MKTLLSSETPDTSNYSELTNRFTEVETLYQAASSLSRTVALEDMLAIVVDSLSKVY